MVASIISIVALGSALTCCSGCDGKRYFQERKKLAVLACTGLVQQTVQIVASHDLTLLVSAAFLFYVMHTSRSKQTGSEVLDPDFFKFLQIL